MLEFQVEMIQLLWQSTEKYNLQVQWWMTGVGELIGVVPGIHNRAKSTKSSHIHSVINIHIRSIIRRLAHTLITPLCIVRNSYLVTSKLYIWPSYITHSFNNVRAQNKSQETFSNLIKKIIAWWRYLMRRMKINKDGYKLRILCEIDIGGSTLLKKKFK